MTSAKHLLTKLVNLRLLYGVCALHPATAETIEDRAEGSGGGSPGHRVLHFPVAHGEEGPPCARADGYLPQDGDVSAPARGKAGAPGGSPAPRGLDEKTGRPASPLVSRGPGVDPPQVRCGQAARNRGDLRKGAVRRSRTPRGPEAPGRRAAHGQRGDRRRDLAAAGRPAQRPQLRATARRGARVPGDGHLQRLGGKLRRVSRSLDRIVGHRPGHVWDGDRVEPPASARAPETIRVRRTTTC